MFIGVIPAPSPAPSPAQAQAQAPAQTYTTVNNRFGSYPDTTSKERFNIGETAYCENKLPFTIKKIGKGPIGQIFLFGINKYNDPVWMDEETCDKQ